MEVLKQSVRPEFLNRIDEIIMFDPLSENDIREILKMQETQLQNKLADDGISIRFTKEFDDYMAGKGYDPAYGARPVKRLLQRELVNQLATAILDGTVHRSSAIEVTVAGGEVVLRDAK